MKNFLNQKRKNSKIEYIKPYIPVSQFCPLSTIGRISFILQFIVAINSEDFSSPCLSLIRFLKFSNLSPDVKPVSLTVKRRIGMK